MALTLEPLLRAIHRGVRPLSPADHVAVRRWLETLGPEDAPTFRAGLASLLARDRRQWEQIARLVDQHAEGRLDQEGATARASAQALPAAPLVLPPEPPTTRWQRWRGILVRRLLSRVDRIRLWTWLLELRPGRVVLALALGVGLVAAGALVYSTWIRPVLPGDDGPGAPISAEARKAVEEVRRESSLQAGDPARTLSVSRPWHIDALSLGVLALASLVPLALGRRLRRLPQEVEGDRREWLERTARQARTQRVALEGERAARGRGPVQLYEVEIFPVFPREVLAEQAERLGRLRRWSGGRDLDVARTLRRTLDAGGMFAPALADRAVPVPLLVLIDREDRPDHPALARFRRLLEAWARQGVPIRSYSFQRNPARVYEDGTDLPLTLADLARRTEGLPLLILSRLLEAERYGRPLSWLDALPAWPRRAWVDPDARALARPDRAAHIALLAGRGLHRFPFDEAGIGAAIACLSGQDRRPPPDPTLPEGPALERALDLWAVAAAHVPEPGWDQLEALRRALPELARALPGPHAVWWLLERMALHPECRGRAESDDGRQLRVPQALVGRLRQQFRRQARTDAGLVDFARRVDRILLDQLGKAEPDPDTDPLGHARWRLRHVVLQARLHPDQAGAFLLGELDNPLRDQLEAEVALEAEVQSAAPVEGLDWAPGSREALGEMQRVTPRIRPLDLLLGARAAWPGARRLAAWAAALALLGVGITLADASLPREGRLPQTWKVSSRRVWPGTPNRPDMVEILPGTFQEGSPTTEVDRKSDEGPREVRITRPFAIGRTEVTQAQYRAVMGENPSAHEYQGVGLFGDDLPVQNVSWLDAVTFCNRLSQVEGLKPAYQVAGDSVVWMQDTDGYRLPTEAEWEYAARAGTRTSFVGTDDIGELCRYGNVADQSGKRQFSDGGVAACDDGVVGLAPVGHYAPNAWGLYDMLGNVFEWVWDWYEDPWDGSDVDPVGPQEGEDRVGRGGSWYSSPRRTRIASRVYWPPSSRVVSLGFRLSRSLPSSL